MNAFSSAPAAAAARRVALSFSAPRHTNVFSQPRFAVRPFPSRRLVGELPAERARNVADAHKLKCNKGNGRGQSGKAEQNTESGGSRGFRAAVGGGAGCMLAASPMLFTDYDKTASPKSELIFMAGNALGYCTERFFENEYGQSIFMFALGLAYLAMLGHEGKIHGAVWRMKHLFATNFRMVGHPRYAYALPKNPLLQETSTAKTGSAPAKK
ncbi:conserved hypothetical protein [Neospora caninum Liverpool]|uniref:Microprotein domain-containing protein n=1 Tax=Neospora caninum (strain Liverpool) TaxID=572307 RepID=F0V7Y3_NEOCL|nr:conserved hypothetical protein [Neospora caninum Liverpool]CBZ49824.1 conserved hypothetical protein [Neospora caninum Liverpool]CEL64414.1 TPA: hypothetical protein BN1204_003110 [Neospora caninum Liverpool]|eukprot:XP_003879859.1 conserved hypothetical protein [Neospora caninum Liverpool]